MDDLMDAEIHAVREALLRFHSLGREQDCRGSALMKVTCEMLQRGLLVETAPEIFEHTPLGLNAAFGIAMPRTA